MDFAERHALAKRLRSSRLAQFAPLIGQFRTFAAAERRRRVKHVPDEVVGVKLGDDLLALTSTEMINMATPEMDDVPCSQCSSGVSGPDDPRVW